MHIIDINSIKKRILIDVINEEMLETQKFIYMGTSSVRIISKMPDAMLHRMTCLVLASNKDIE